MRRTAMVVLLTVLSLAGCGGASSSGGSGGSPTPSGSPPAAVHLTFPDTGRTIELVVGQQLSIALDGTQWTVGVPQPPGPLQVATSPSAVPSTCTPVGSGCGTTTASYIGATPGTVMLAAHRTTCGEAAPCPAGKSNWRITVRVS